MQQGIPPFKVAQGGATTETLAAEKRRDHAVKMMNQQEDDVSGTVTQLFRAVNFFGKRQRR